MGIETPPEPAHERLTEPCLSMQETQRRASPLVELSKRSVLPMCSDTPVVKIKQEVPQVRWSFEVTTIPGDEIDIVHHDLVKEIVAKWVGTGHGFLAMLLLDVHLDAVQDVHAELMEANVHDSEEDPISNDLVTVMLFQPLQCQLESSRGVEKVFHAATAAKILPA